MTPAALLAELRSLDFRVRVSGGRLLVTTPTGGALHPDDRAAIQAARAGLLAELEAESWPADPVEGHQRCPGCKACRWKE